MNPEKNRAEKNENRVMNPKKQIRAYIQQQKESRTEAELLAKSQRLWVCIEHLPEFVAAKTVLAYWSMPGEVQTHGFIEKWACNKQFLLPVIDGNRLQLKQFTEKSALVTGAAYDILEPSGPEFKSYQHIDLVLVPGVAFDQLGNRLGFGKGYYDRLLPHIKAPFVGLCYDFQLLEHLPTNEHDVRMNRVLWT